MSTMSTQLNWGASYLVHDIYARFIQPSADEGHYVRVARITTLGLMAASVVVTLYLEQIDVREIEKLVVGAVGPSAGPSAGSVGFGSSSAISGNATTFDHRNLSFMTFGNLSVLKIHLSLQL